MFEVAALTESLLVMSRSIAVVKERMPAKGNRAFREDHIFSRVSKLFQNRSNGRGCETVAHGSLSAGFA